MDTIRPGSRAATASSFSRPNDEVSLEAGGGIGAAPYPTSSPPEPRRCFLIASANVGQWLGLAVGGFVSLAASLEPAGRPLSASPWLVLFMLVVLSSAVSWYVATRSGPGGSTTTPTFCCNWANSADFRAAVADVLVICAGYGLGLGVTSAGVPSGVCCGRHGTRPLCGAHQCAEVLLSRLRRRLAGDGLPSSRSASAASGVPPLLSVSATGAPASPRTTFGSIAGSTVPSRTAESGWSPKRSAGVRPRRRAGGPARDNEEPANRQYHMTCGSRGHSSQARAPSRRGLPKRAGGGGGGL